MTKAVSLDLGRQRVPDIIARIKDSYGALRPAEQLVADAVLSNVQMAVDASNAEIASRAGVSQPTVTRFCRAIGCDGVRDFKLKPARSLAVRDVFLAAAADISLTARAAEYPDILTPSASRFAFLTIIDLVSSATGYRIGPTARENLRRIKYNAQINNSGAVYEPLGD